MVCSGGPLLLRGWIHQVAQLRRKRNIEVIWVTSGAISSAVERTGFRKDKRSLAEKQALSAIGQPLLMDLYNLSLQSVGLLGAQVLLTYDDMAHPGRRKNLEGTLATLLDWGVVPVLNENDAVATEEIRFGDNDSLSARVASMMGADRLVILTDVEGLFDRDPTKHKDAKLVPEVPGVDEALLKTTGKGAGSAHGTGGMYSKLFAAQEAGRHGIDTWLVKGDVANVLVRLADGERLGSHIGSAP